MELRIKLKKPIELDLPKEVVKDSTPPPRRLARKITAKPVKIHMKSKDEHIEGENQYALHMNSNKPTPVTKVVNTSQWGRIQASIPKRQVEAPAIQSHKSMLTELYTSNEPVKQLIEDPLHSVFGSKAPHTSKQIRR